MNSAQRALNIYDTLISIRNDIAMRQVWMEVFQLDANEPDLENQISDLLIALRKQMDAISATLASSYEVPNELLQPGFNRLKETASPAHLNAGWNGLKSNIQAPECRQAFMWASWVLRNEKQKELSDEDLIKLLTELKNFEKTISNTDMSTRLRDFLLEKVTEMINAILLSKVQGSEAVNEACEKIWGSMIIKNADFESEIEGSEKTKNVVEIFKDKFYAFAQFGDNVDKFIALGKAIGTSAGYFLNFFK